VFVKVLALAFLSVALIAFGWAPCCCGGGPACVAQACCPPPGVSKNLVLVLHCPTVPCVDGTRLYLVSTGGNSWVVSCAQLCPANFYGVLVGHKFTLSCASTYWSLRIDVTNSTTNTQLVCFVGAPTNYCALRDGSGQALIFMNSDGGACPKDANGNLSITFTKTAAGGPVYFNGNPSLCTLAPSSTGTDNPVTFTVTEDPHYQCGGVATYCCPKPIPGVLQWNWARVSGACTSFDAMFAALGKTLYADTRDPTTGGGQATAVYQWFDVQNPTAFGANAPRVWFGCNSVQTAAPKFNYATYFSSSSYGNNPGRLPGNCFPPFNFNPAPPPGQAGHSGAANIDPPVCLDPFSLTFTFTIYFSPIGNDFSYTPECCPPGSTTVYEIYVTTAGTRSGPDGAAPPTAGPGTELRNLLARFGVPEPPGCECDSRVAQMNAWGVEGCRSHRAEIVAWLRGEWAKLDGPTRRRAIRNAILAGFIHPVDPVGALVDRAIRQAEDRAAGEGGKHVD